MRKIIAFLMTCVMCFSLAGCGGNETTNEPEPSNVISDAPTGDGEPELLPTEPAGLPPAMYETIRWDRSYVTETGESGENYYVDYIRLLGDDPAFEKINTDLYAKAEKLINKYPDGQELASWGFGNSGYYTAEFSVTHNQGGIFCITITTDSYTGGNTSHIYDYHFCYNLYTGDLATLTELTGRDGKSLLPELRKIAWEGLQQQYGNLLFDGVENQISHMALEDFRYCIKDGQILLYFEKYTVTDGSAGDTRIPTGLYLSEIAPPQPDSDGDGYPDDIDCNPNEPYKVPIILLHGRDSNTGVFFGVHTAIDKEANSIYGTDNEQLFTSADKHEILSVEDGKLGQYLKDTLEYQENKNLFAFNYPNADMVEMNAKRFAQYVKNLIDAAATDSSDTANFVDAKYLFATKDDQKNKKVQFILIGHSMGGLVSRYYIENMDDQYVQKLITICTPHYGSGWGLASDITGIDFLPCDVDLQKGSRLFGGEKQRAHTHEGTKEAYAYLHQSLPLKGNRNTDVAYYAIGGYNADVSYDKPQLNNPVFSEMSEKMKTDLLQGRSFAVRFDIHPENKDAFDKAIIEEVNRLTLSLYGESSDFEFYGGGDNVVNYMSQFGVRFDSQGRYSDHQEIQNATLIITTGFSFPLRMLHTNIATESLMHEAVIHYINLTE